MSSAGEQRRGIRGRIALLSCFGALVALVAADGAAATAPVGSNGKIAYSRPSATSSEIFVINPDGTGTTNLTKTPTLNESEPSWSPDGMKVAFTRCASTFDCDVVVMNADGSGVTNLTNTGGAVAERRPAFSPDGLLIAYDRATGNVNGTAIWVMNRDGTNQHPLTSTALPDSDFTPDFSPDGNTITYSHCTGAPDHQCDIWSMNADGSGQHGLTNTHAPNSELGGSFSPDGARIVFQVDTGNTGTDDLAIMNADGSGRRPLTQTAAGERRPVFSGDGLRLAFSFTDAVTNDIYTSDANAQGQTNLTQTPSSTDRENTPDWEDVQTCGGKRATIVGDDGPDSLFGTKKGNVVDANAASGGKNVVKGKGGNDLICVGPGKAKVNCGKGKRDKVIATGKGKRKVKGCEIKKGKFGKPKGK